MTARYIIGIDLGTTNTAVAYVDTRAADQKVHVFNVPQLVAPGEVAARKQLPSFVYLTGEHDLSPAETALPWDAARRRVVGELARAQGARVASRMIASAKSWLCHGGVDREADILPWAVDVGVDEGSDKLSPVAASASVLGHVREAWDYARRGEPDAAFVDQEIIVTVPASFDEAARELTVEAAQAAGIGKLVLVEEPQAAFYAWMDEHAAAERKAALRPGDTVLVFDIGGGTTDFTLIGVGDDGDSFERTAVGDHLLLGGDNIDLTLAKQVEARLQKKLDALQWHSLVHACRLAKETLLSDDAVARVPVTIAGRGSKLIGGTLKDEIDREQLTDTVLDGFFPVVESRDVQVRARGGLQEFGLPYAADPAVTRHLAAFLTRHGADRIGAVLFNGGAMTPASLRRRVIDQIARWQPDAEPPRELANAVPELAVAKGAAYYGLVRRGLGARIRGGTPRAFYVGVGAARGVDAGPIAVCIAGRGLEEGSSVELERDFALTTNRPVSFKLYSSTTREDEPGDLARIGDGTPDTADDDSDLLELPPIVTVLRAPGRSSVVVRLEVRVTELGALEIWCREQAPPDGKEPGRWRLTFDMRSGGAARPAGAADDAPAAGLTDEQRAAQELVRASFRGASDTPPAQLMKALEQRLDARRDEWSMTTTRALFDAAIDVEDARTRDRDVEARWIHFAAFCLRPGTGAPLDDWRIKQMWRVFNQGLAFEKFEAARLAWWIAWRRIAGGMSQGQQEQIYDRLAQLFLPGAKQKSKWYKVKPSPQEAGEMLRTLANLERLDVGAKLKLGDELMARLQSKKGQADPLHVWALGRIGSRVPLYGPLNCVVPAPTVAAWIPPLLEVAWPEPEKAAFPIAQLGRRTGDRARDISDELRERLARYLESMDAPNAARCARLVREIVSLEDREERVALGDSLPPGLRLLRVDE